MHIAAYIVLALAFAISNMLLFRRCAELTPIRLTRGLGLTLCVAAVQTALFLLGMVLGNLLRFELPDDSAAFSTANAMIFLGLDIFVMLRMLLPHLRREPRLPLFDLGNGKATIAISLTAAINPLLVGLGAGFVASSADIHKLWPIAMLVLLWIFGYWGVMLGRRKVAIRPVRWMVIAAIMLLGVGIAAMVNA
ncbi:MAG: hypothetical protein IKR83_02270 [Bacteroidales bacterium]|nr:hypothetical protein [Bacteroidales bacterium]